VDGAAEASAESVSVEELGDTEGKGTPAKGGRLDEVNVSLCVGTKEGCMLGVTDGNWVGL